MRRNIYAVQTAPVRDEAGAIAGWLRTDPLADGSSPTDTVFLRDGSSCGQAEAMRRVQLDRTLLYSTDEEAVLDGIARLRDAHRRGATVPLASVAALRGRRGTGRTSR